MTNFNSNNKSDIVKCEKKQNETKYYSKEMDRQEPLRPRASESN